MTTSSRNRPSSSAARTRRSAHSGSAVERAIKYARNHGVTPVAALGNSDQDLAHPVDENGQPIDNECEVVPAETQGVIGTVALGTQREGGYSNYGAGEADVSAPGGNGTPVTARTTILSTFPGGLYGCIQGTSWPRRTPPASRP